MLLIKLFLSFLRIGLFAVGGAYSFLPLIEKEVVQKYNWLTKSEFLDVLGITSVFPGAISIKYATYTGYKIAGIPGAIAANAGNFLGPMLFILFAGTAYLKYKDLPAMKGAFSFVRLAVFAMIIAVAFQPMNAGQLFQAKGMLVALVSFCLFYFTKIHPAAVIVCAAFIGALWR